VRLYVRGIADAILEGRSQIVQQIVRDEFVEVDSSEEQAPA
jgi:small subunit ribosomal protein S2